MPHRRSTLLAQAGHLDVDHKLSMAASPGAPAPSRPRAPAFPGTRAWPLVTKQIFEQLEFSGRQIEEPFPANGAPAHQIHLQVRRLEAKRLRRTTSPEQRLEFSPAVLAAQTAWRDSRPRPGPGRALDRPPHRAQSGSGLACRCAAVSESAGSRDRCLTGAASRPARPGRTPRHSHAEEAILTRGGNDDVVVLAFLQRAEASAWASFRSSSTISTRTPGILPGGLEGEPRLWCARRVGTGRNALAGSSSRPRTRIV